MKPTIADHCRHARCCQCGAARGTPEHARACPDVMISRALAKRGEGYTPRKLEKCDAVSAALPSLIKVKK